MIDVSDFLEDFDCDEFVNRTKSGKRSLRSEKPIPYEGKDLTGVDRNPEGREMANIVFAIDKGRWPNAQESKDYHKDVTDGHAEPINDVYDYRIETFFGEKYVGKSPYFMRKIVEDFLKNRNN